MKILNMLHQKYSKKAKDSRRGKNIRESLEKQGDGQQLPDVKGIAEMINGRPEPDVEGFADAVNGRPDSHITEFAMLLSDPEMHKKALGIFDQSDEPKK